MEDPKTIQPRYSLPIDGDKVNESGGMVTWRLLNKRTSEHLATPFMLGKGAKSRELGGPKPTDPVSELPADAGDGIAQSMWPTHTGNMDENPRAEKRKKLEQLIANPDVSLQPKTD